MVHANQFHQTATKTVNSNWASNNAINANHAKPVKLSEETDVSLQLHAHAIKLSTLPLTLVQTAQSDNSLLTVDNAKLFLNHVTKMDNSNWANNNAINANHAKPVKSSEETDALPQLTAHVTKPSTLHQTLARTAQPVPSVSTMAHANQLQDNAMPTIKFNWANNNATNANNAKPVKLSLETDVLSQEIVHAIKLLMLHLTLVLTAQLVNSV